MIGRAINKILNSPAWGIISKLSDDSIKLEFAAGKRFNYLDQGCLLFYLRRQMPAQSDASLSTSLTSGISISDSADPLFLGDVKPGKALFGKVLLFRRLKLGGLIKRTDMKMRFRRPWESFASQS